MVLFSLRGDEYPFAAVVFLFVFTAVVVRVILAAAGFDDDAFFVFDALPAAADCVFFAAVLVLGAVVFAVPAWLFLCCSHDSPSFHFSITVLV